VQGVNVGGILLGYLAVLVFATVFLVALGLWFAGKSAAARIVAAVGLFATTIIGALASLTCLAPAYYRDSDAPLIVETSLSLILAGTGQFVAALRNRRMYGASLVCAIVAITYATLAGLGGSDVLPLKLPAGPAIGILLGLVSMIVAFRRPRGVAPTTFH
jgi:hypothetical protein